MGYEVSSSYRNSVFLSLTLSLSLYQTTTSSFYNSYYNNNSIKRKQISRQKKSSKTR